MNSSSLVRCGLCSYKVVPDVEGTEIEWPVFGTKWPKSYKVVPDVEGTEIDFDAPARLFQPSYKVVPDVEGTEIWLHRCHQVM